MTVKAETKTLQQKIGASISAFTFLILLIRIMNRYGLSETLGIATVLVIFIFTIFIDKRIFRFIQALIFLMLGYFYVFVDYSGFASYWMLINGVVLLYKYGFLDRHTVVKLAIITAGFVGFMLGAVVVNHVSLFIAIKYTLFTGFSFLGLFFLFEEQVLSLQQENTSQSTQLVELKPIIILGGRTAAIVHSFKNIFSQLSSATFYIKEDIDRDKGLEILQKGIKELHKRMDALLAISRAGYSLERKLIDVTSVVMNVKYILLEDADYKRNAKIEFNLEPNIYSDVIELEFIITMENIFRNAIEAIIETGHYGWIHVTMDREKIEVISNGGAIPTCIDCPRSCLECKRFSKIGYTTKKTGSGNGVPQIIQFARSNNWDVQIRGFDDKTSVTLYYKRKEVS